MRRATIMSLAMATAMAAQAQPDSVERGQQRRVLRASSGPRRPSKYMPGCKPNIIKSRRPKS